MMSPNNNIKLFPQVSNTAGVLSLRNVQGIRTSLSACSSSYRQQASKLMRHFPRVLSRVLSRVCRVFVSCLVIISGQKMLYFNGYDSLGAER